MGSLKEASSKLEKSKNIQNKTERPRKIKRSVENPEKPKKGLEKSREILKKRKQSKRSPGQARLEAPARRRGQSREETPAGTGWLNKFRGKYRTIAANASLLKPNSCTHTSRLALPSATLNQI